MAVDDRHDDDLRAPGAGLTLHEERLVGGVESHEAGRVEVRKRIVVEEMTVVLPVRREVADVVRVYPDGSEEVLETPTTTWQPRVEDRTGHEPYGGARDEQRDGAVDAAPDDDAALREAAQNGHRNETSFDVVLHEERPVITTEVYAVERVRLRTEQQTEVVRHEAEVRREVADIDGVDGVDGRLGLTDDGAERQ